MKSKLTKIMGVALALVLVFSLGVAFMPTNTPGGPVKAVAADLAWSTISVPSTTSNVLITAAKDLGPVAISPNYANDNTVWAIVNDPAATPTVYKSTNGGHTWTVTTTALGAAADVGIALVVSDNYAEDNTIFIAIQTPLGNAGTGKVYRSVNGGSSFGQLGVVTLAANEVITDMDVAPNYDGTGVLAVSCANILSATVMATPANCVQLWGSNATLSWTGVAPGVAVDVSAVEFSPNYVIDSTIMVVASLVSDEPQLRAIVGGTWDGSGYAATNVGATLVTDVDYRTNGVATDLLAAAIALPSDFNGQIATTRRAYVSIVGEAGPGATTSNVYRITNVTAGTAIATASAIELSNLEYSGDFAEGTLIGGQWNDAAAGAAAADVYRTTNPTSSVVNWYAVSGAANKPTGTATATQTDNTTTFVKMSYDYATDSTVVVGTIGDDSAFGVSTNGAVSFNEMGLIDNGAGATLLQLSGLAMTSNYASGGAIFLISDNVSAAAGDTNVWVSYDSGALWERCFTALFNASGIGVVAPSTDYATDSVVYVGDQGALPIWYSSNGGQSWSARAVTGLTGIQTIAAPDATTVYVGDSASGQVGKSTNSGWTWPTALRKASGAATRVASLKVQDSTVLVGGGAGTVRRSDDGGATWAKISATILAANMYVDFDGTTVYTAALGTGQVYRSVDGGGWTTLTMPTAGVWTAAAIELILAEDGSLYMLDSTAVAATRDSVWRCINPTSAEPSPGTTWQSMATIPTAAQAMNMAVASGSNTIGVLIDTGGGTTADSFRMNNDTLSAGTAGPNLVAPADGSTLTRAQTTRFTIEALNKVTTYGHQWSTDSTFASGTTNTAITAPSVQTAAIAVTEGATVYWRVRATAPFNGPWSEVWTVETQITTAVQAPAPTYPGGLAGSTVNVPIDLVFNWGAFKFASGYEIQLANDSGMTDLIADMTGDSALGNVTSYKPESTLEYSSTYYWRVRAIKGTATAYSDWSAVVGFTTEAEPVEPAPPIIIEPTPAPAPAPAPSTPGYIWAIIAIGAVLAIVVIVLIVRTRRIA